MKYIKLYENIDFEDISEEEFDDNILNNIHIKPGDIIISQSIYIWYNNKWFNYYYDYDYYDDYNNNSIDKIEISDNITNNPYNDYKDKFQKIPNGEIILSIKGFPYWVNYNKNIKIE